MLKALVPGLLYAGIGWLHLSLMTAAAASPHVAFFTMSVEDGLPSNNVAAVVQDADGFMWMGTNDGLARFDGHEFEVFRNDPSDPDSLAGNWIETLMSDSQDRVWFGAEHGGLGWIEDGVPRNILSSDPGGPVGDNIWSIAEASDGALWLAVYGHGLQRFDPATRTFDPPLAVRVSEDSEQQALIFALEFDHRDRLWIGTVGAGAHVYDQATDSVQRFRADPDDPDSLAHDVVFDLERHGDAMWLATRGGLSVKSPGRDGFTTRLGPDEISFPGLEYQYSNLFADSRGGIWAASTRHLFRVDPAGGVELFEHTAGVRATLPQAEIHHVYEDREKQIWVSTEGGGIARLKPDWRNFRFLSHEPGNENGLPNDLYCGLVHTPHGLWTCLMRAGLARVDVTTGETRLLDASEIGLRVQSLVSDGQGNAWVGAEGALAHLNTQTGEIDERHPIAFGDAGVRLIPVHLAAHGNAVWLGVEGVGLLRFDRALRTFEAFTPDRRDGRGLRGVQIEEIAIVDGEVWVAHEAGIDRLAADVDGFRPLLADQQSVHAFERVGDEVWISHRQGLARYRLEAGKLALLEQRVAPDRLPPIEFGDITTDRQGQLWLTSSRGLYQFVANEDQVRHYTHRDGLPTAEFHNSAMETDNEGRIYAGSLAGIVIFQPETLTHSGSAPPVRINQVSTAAGPLALGDVPSLPHDVSDLTIRFNALSLVEPERNLFAYRLVGLEEDWIQAGSRRERTYSYLPPGDYVFEVIASDASGVWNTDAASYAFRVTPPPWLTPWAFALYLLLLAGGVWVAIGSYRRRVDRRSELVRARERQQWAETQRDMTLSLTSSLQVDDILDRLLDGMRDVVEFDRAAVCILSQGLPEATRLRGYGEKIGPSTRDVRNTINAFRREGFDEPSTLSAMGQVGKTMTVPVGAGDEVLGVATLLRQVGEPDLERARLMVSSYARQAGIALQNARLYREVKSLAEEADSANRAKSDFLAKMSHEIRTPMNGVLGMTELLLETGLNADQSRYARAVQDSGKVLLSIINDILDLSKIEAGRLELEQIDFQLGPTIEETVKLFSANADKAGLEFGYIIHADTPRQVRGDPTRLRQVVMNLLGNALKFTSAGCVCLTVRRGDGGIRFEVRDTGIGMGEDEVSQLFQPFTQADQSTTRRYGGTGLGLAICKQLVEHMGGMIEVESERGAGSTFSFELPIGGLAPEAARLPGSDWFGQGPTLVALRDGVARSFVCELITHYGGAVMVPGDEMAERPVMLIADESVRRAPLLAKADRFHACLWMDRSNPPGPHFRPLPPPLFESDFVMALISATEPGLVSLPAGEEDTAPSRSLRLLLVEDNQMNQTLLMDMLESLGHQVDIVDNPEDCLKQMAVSSYDLVLMDCDLPGDDGPSLVARIRKSGPHESLPVVALTAHASDEYRQRCLEAGMQDHVSKPVSKKSLAQVIARVTGQTSHSSPGQVAGV